MVVCVYLPRFELTVAAGGEGLLGRALALAPRIGADRPGSGQRIGEISGAAEARGVGAGMMLGEALVRCPELVLVPPDPLAVGDVWEAVLCGLEGIGAAVEPGHPGLAWFAAEPLRGLYGGDEATLSAAARAVRGGDAARQPRIGAGPTPFCALACALAVRSRKPFAVADEEARCWLSNRPVELLGYRPQTVALVEPLRRLGVGTLGEVARLGRHALADRFGAAGAFAWKLAVGKDEPLRPRSPGERLRETMSVGDANSGQALERVLGVLVDRLLARPERRGRALGAVAISARLAGGAHAGTWHERAVFRQALSDRRRICLAICSRLALLPGPVAELGLAVERFGPPAGTQRSLLDRSPEESRAVRLREAIAQMRAVAGLDAALRAVCVDPDSRVPERRTLLAPLQC